VQGWQESCKGTQLRCNYKGSISENDAWNKAHQYSIGVIFRKKNFSEPKSHEQFTRRWATVQVVWRLSFWISFNWVNFKDLSFLALNKNTNSLPLENSCTHFKRWCEGQFHPYMALHSINFMDNAKYHSVVLDKAIWTNSRKAVQ